MNAGEVRSRFKVMLAEKETREGRSITYDEIQKETGVAKSTLTAWAKNTVGFETLAKLCAFFECQPGELLQFLPAETAPTPAPAAPEKPAGRARKPASKKGKGK